MDTLKRPAHVAASAWIIIVTSALLFIMELVRSLVGLVRAPGTPTVLFVLIFFFLGLGYAVVRLALGVAILRGFNWARVLYLVGEVLVLNLGVALLRKSESLVTSRQTVYSLLAILTYLIPLILLTRRPALIFLGRPIAPAMKTNRVVLAMVLFCFLYAGIAAVANALGAPTMSVVSDRYNPVSLLGNVLGEATGLSFFQSATERERLALVKAIDGAKSDGEFGEFIGHAVFKAQVAVNENEAWIFLIWIVNFVALGLLLRRH